MNSETNSCRDRLAKFCEGPNGLDIGFGGLKPIVDHAICLDLALGNIYRAKFNEWIQHLTWDAFGSLPFKDNTLGWVFSSHCLEDAVDTHAVLVEWVRVIKPNGYLALFLPDQQTYLKEVQKAIDAGKDCGPNESHKHADFSLAFVKAKLPANVRVVHELFPVPNNAYSFDLVVQKL